MQDTETATIAAEADTDEVTPAKETEGTETGQPPADDKGAAPEQPDADELKAKLDDLTEHMRQQQEEMERRIQEMQRDFSSETDRRVTQAVQKKETEHAAELRQLRTRSLMQRIRDGDTDALAELETTLSSAFEEPKKAEEDQGRLAQAQIEGLAAGFSFRIDDLKPTDAERAGYVALFHAGQFQQLHAALAEAERKKFGPTETKPPQAGEKKQVAEARKDKGPDLSDSRGGSRAKDEKAEARAILRSQAATPQEKREAYKTIHGYYPRA